MMDEKTVKTLLKKVVDDYDNIANEFDTTRKREWKEFEEFLPYIKDGQSIADIGCGNGRFYAFLKKSQTHHGINKKINYTGVDNSKKLLEIAKKEHKTNFIYGDLLKIPLEDKTQDIVVSIAALHHIPTEKLRKKAISNLHKILKKDGTLIITVWNLHQPKYKKYIGKNFGPQDSLIPWGKSGIERYYYAFKPDELKGLLKEKFEVIKFYKGNNFVFICRKK